MEKICKNRIFKIDPVKHRYIRNFKVFKKHI